MKITLGDKVNLISLFKDLLLLLYQTTFAFETSIGFFFGEKTPPASITMIYVFLGALILVLITNQNTGGLFFFGSFLLDD